MKYQIFKQRNSHHNLQLHKQAKSDKPISIPIIKQKALYDLPLLPGAIDDRHMRVGNDDEGGQEEKNLGAHVSCSELA